MPLVNSKEMLERAHNEGYAVGAFNIVNYCTLEAVMMAAEAEKTPVIIQTSQKTVEQLGYQALFTMVKQIADRSPVPAALHLDHGTKMDVINGCIDNGWTSVMIDASKYAFEENMRLTKEVVGRAHPKGITVEGELGQITGVEDDIKVDEMRLANLEEVNEFQDKTGVDSLAIAIGTAHGMYKTAPKLDFDRLQKCRKMVTFPIVVHGCTGLTEETMRRIVSLGASKLNISTIIKITYIDGLKNYIDAHPDEYNPLKLIKHARDEVSKVVREIITWCGSSNKA